MPGKNGKLESSWTAIEYEWPMEEVRQMTEWAVGNDPTVNTLARALENGSVSLKVNPVTKGGYVTASLTVIDPKTLNTLGTIWWYASSPYMAFQSALFLIEFGDPSGVVKQGVTGKAKF